jgi:hypothetical protein
MPLPHKSGNIAASVISRSACYHFAHLTFYYIYLDVTDSIIISIHFPYFFVNFFLTRYIKAQQILIVCRKGDTADLQITGNNSETVAKKAG